MASLRIKKLLKNNFYFSSNQIRDSEFLETKMYRYYSLTDLIESLSIKKMRLKKPHLWQDPFENIFLKLKVLNTNGQLVDLTTSREQIFAQCWTLKAESDLMWNSYVKDKLGAKVSTTIKQILDIVKNHDIAFLSGIKYMSESEIRKIFSSPVSLDVKAEKDSFWTTLFIKRKEFEDEQEVRIIFHDIFRNNNPNYKIKVANFNVNEYKRDYTYFDFNPDQVFNEIILHPKMKEKKIDCFTNKLRKYYNGPIYKSKLYDVPEIIIRTDNKAT